MSRGAAALAYEPADTIYDYAPTPAPRQPRDLHTGSYRLLGESDDLHDAESAYNNIPHSALRTPQSDVLRYIIPAARTAAAEERAGRPYDAEAISYYSAPSELRRPLHVSPRLLLGIGLGLLMLLAVGTPAIGATLSRNSQGILLSGYSDPAQTAKKSSPGQKAQAAPVEAPDSHNAVGPAANSAAAPPAVQRPSGNYELTGPPSTSVQQIEQVLRQYGSPAAGHGQTLYDLGVKYGIDPAYALAFFVHESGCGTQGVARFTKSLGNIRWTEGFGNYEGYRSYNSWADGIEDWYKLITNLYIGGWNLRTVDAIIPVYAPWGDNNHPPTYIASIKSMVDNWRGK